jgi:hypothetical protein
VQVENKGTLVTIVNKDGVKTETVANAVEGITTVTVENTKQGTTTVTKYDSSNNITEIVEKDSTGYTTTTTITYNDDGTKVAVKTDSNGKEIEKITYNPDDSYIKDGFAPVLTVGDGSTYDTTSALKFRSDDDFVNFLSVKVDDKAIDSKNYVAEKGSIIVTLNKSYLDTLKLGTHTISIVSTNGEAKGTFTVTKTSAKDKTENATTENQTTENATTENQTTENATTEKSTTENITTEAQTTVVASDKTKLTSSNTDSSPDTGDAIDFILILSLLSITLTGLLYTTKIRRK